MFYFQIEESYNSKCRKVIFISIQLSSEELLELHFVIFWKIFRRLRLQALGSSRSGERLWVFKDVSGVKPSIVWWFEELVEFS